MRHDGGTLRSPWSTKKASMSEGGREADVHGKYGEAERREWTIRRRGAARGETWSNDGGGEVDMAIEEGEGGRADGSFMQGTIVNQSRGSVSRVCGPGVTTGRAGVIEGEERRERGNRDDKYCFCHYPWDVRGAASSLSELESRGRG